MTIAFDVTTVTTTEGLRDLEADWRRLCERAGDVLPYVLPGWLLPWWGSFRQERVAIRDSLRVQVVRRAGEIVAILPFMLTERPAGGPLRARAIGLLGTDPNITEQRGIVCDPRYQAEVAMAIGARLRADPGWDWIRWDGLDRGSEFARVLEQEMPLRWGRAETAYVLPLRGPWEAFRGGLKRNVKESLRRCYNSLKRDGLEARLRVAESPADVAAALPVFFALHTARAQTSDGPAHPDRFAAAPARGFLLDACRSLAEQGITRVFTLEVGATPVACRIAFELPGWIYLYYSGFDPAWSRYSVMTTTVAEIIKYAIARGVPRMHLSMGADVSKSRWGAETSLVHEATTVRPGWKARSALGLYEAVRDSTRLRRMMGPAVRQRREAD